MEVEPQEIDEEGKIGIAHTNGGVRRRSKENPQITIDTETSGCSRRIPEMTNETTTCNPEVGIEIE